MLAKLCLNAITRRDVTDDWGFLAAGNLVRYDGDHNQEIYRPMGKLVAGGKQLDFADLLDTYEELLLKTQTYLNPHPFELKLRNYF